MPWVNRKRGPGLSNAASRAPAPAPAPATDGRPCYLAAANNNGTSPHPHSDSTPRSSLAAPPQPSHHFDFSQETDFWADKRQEFLRRPLSSHPLPGHHRQSSSVYSQDGLAPHDPAYTFGSIDSGPLQHNMAAPVQSFPAQAALKATSNTPQTTSATEPQAKKGFSSYLPTWRGNAGKSEDSRSSPEPTSESTKRDSGTTVADRIRNAEKKSETRWDPYRGEIRRDGGGKPGQIHPKAWEEKLAKENSYNVLISSNGDEKEKTRKPSWAERATKLTKDTLDNRPPWKGAGGRTAVVDPVKDTSVPRNDAQFTAVRRVSTNGIPEGDSTNSLDTVSTSNISVGNTSPPMPPSVISERDEDEWNDSTLEGMSPTIATAKALPIPKTEQRSSRSTIIKKPVASGVTYEAPKSPDIQRDPESWDTLNSAQHDSPPPSPQAKSASPEEKTLWRKGLSFLTKPPTPPPTESQRPARISPVPAEPGKLVRTRALPPASPTMTHVETLMLDEEDIARRRRKIMAAIHQLELIDHASPLDVDWKSAKANKKRLEERQAELADLEVQQHQIGRALVRARRKAEDEDGMESGLWVRRVTQ